MPAMTRTRSPTLTAGGACTGFCTLDGGGAFGFPWASCLVAFSVSACSSSVESAKGFRLAALVPGFTIFDVPTDLIFCHVR